MKTKFLLIIAFLAHILVYSQSQRLILVEEFTQASCGPCAQQNPAFNSMLQQNTSKAASVKYQTDFPGTDPMNAQNPVEIKNRVNFYGVGGVPTAIMDGVAKGAPANVNQSAIDNQYAVPSPFSIQLNYWFNSANDSVFINCGITCTQNTTMNMPKLRLAMIEKTITFANPPGSNGEKVFYNVMRKMYPNAAGAVIEPAWSSGQKKNFSYSAAIPSYIYKKSEIAFVAWIQDDGNKNIAQAGYSPSPGSDSQLAPEADFSSDVSSSCDGIVQFRDQSAFFPKSWLWEFGDGTTSTLKNPTHRYNSGGTFTVKLTASNANGGNQVTKTSFVTVSNTGSAPIGKNGTRCGPGPVNLSATPSGSGTLNWFNSSGNLVNTGNNYTPTISSTTNFYVSEMTLNPVLAAGATTNTIGTGGYFTANNVHGLYFNAAKPCTLISVMVYANTAGNRTFQMLDASGAVVQSAVKNLPAGQSTVSLNFPIGAGSGYLLKISSTTVDLYRNSTGASYPYTNNVITITGSTASSSGPGYYYYFYDWKVQQNACSSPSAVVSAIDSCTTTGVNNQVSEEEFFTVSPNPGNGLFTVSFRSKTTDDFMLTVTNALGQVIYEDVLNGFTGTFTGELDITSFGKGVYVFSISGKEKKISRKTILY